MAQHLLVVGAVGPIGDSVLDAVARNPEIFVVFALSAHGNMKRLFEQCLRFEPKLAIVSEPHHAIELQAHLQASRLRTEVQCGVEALCAAAGAPECDMVVAIAGAAGLLPAMSAARVGKKILLAKDEGLLASTHRAPEVVNVH